MNTAATIPTLQNWYLTGNPYAAPEARRLQMAGNVHGSSRFDEGAHITTSHIAEVYMNDGRLCAVTASGSRYLLGEVSQEYEKEFPGARDRMKKMAEVDARLIRGLPTIFVLG